MGITAELQVCVWWVAIVSDLLFPLPPSLPPSLQQCGNYVLGAIYLLVFITIGAFIFANLVVAVVVTNLVRHTLTTLTPSPVTLTKHPSPPHRRSGPSQSRRSSRISRSSPS